MSLYRYRADGSQYLFPAGNTAMPASVILDVDIDSAELDVTDDRMRAHGYTRISDADPASAIQLVEDLSVSTTTDDVFQPKLTLASGELAEGTYSFAWVCEIRVNPATSTEGVQAQLAVNGTEQYQDNWDLAQWHLFGGAGSAQFSIGATPVFSLNFRRLGPSPANVEIRRARMSLTLESSS